MSTVNLIKSLNSNEYKVLFREKSTTVSEEFMNVDDATQFLCDVLKVNDDDIDDAIIQMAAYKHNVAVFSDGKFRGTE